jgi:hypothetical protein
MPSVNSGPSSSQSANSTTAAAASSLPAIQSSLLARIRAGLALSANGNNPADRAPLLAPPAWVTSTAYIVGQVVTNTGGGAGNLYICSVAGTSGATGPTGQAAATQVDGTASWQYFGPALTTTSNPLAPTVSFANFTSCGSASYFWCNAAQTTQKAATGSPNFFTLDGGFWQNNTLFGGTPGMWCYAALGASNTGATTVGGITSNYWANPSGQVTFYTDAPKFMLGGAVNVNAAGPGGGFVEIDDIPLSDSPFYNTTNNNFGLLIDYTAVGGRKTRKVRLYCHSLSGVSTFDNISQVWAYTAPNPYKIGWIGDSISAGSNGGPFGELNYSAMARFCRMCGCESLFNQAVGGMGFWNVINTYTFQTSAVSFTLYNPDVIILCGNYDDAGATSLQRTSSVITCLTYLRGAFPNAMLLGFGPWGSVQNGSASWLQLEADMQAGFTAMNDPNIFFIPLMNRSTGLPWVTGTGTIAAPGNGNSSEYVYSDSVHPTALAHKEYIPRVYAMAFRNLIGSFTAY